MYTFLPADAPRDNTNNSRIENYSILLASCAPVARLFLRAFVDHRREGRSQGYWSRSRSTTDNDHDTELKRRRGKSKEIWTGSVSATRTNVDEENPALRWDGYEHERTRTSSRASRASKVPTPVPGDGGVTVKTDISIQIDDGRSVSSGGARLLPDGSEVPESYR